MYYKARIMTVCKNGNRHYTYARSDRKCSDICRKLDERHARYVVEKGLFHKEDDIINRYITDVADTNSEYARDNLRRSGFSDKSIDAAVYYIRSHPIKDEAIRSEGWNYAQLIKFSRMYQ